MERNGRGARARRFGAFHLQVDHDRVLTAAHDDAFAGLVVFGVYFLMRHPGRDEDEVAGAGFAGEFEAVAPAHAGAAADDVEDGYEFAVVVWTGFGVGLDHYGAGPESGRAGSGIGDGGGARHAGSLRGVGIELARADDFDSVVFPVFGFGIH